MRWSTGLVVALSLALTAAGCGAEEDGPSGGTGASATAAGSGATGTGGGGSGGAGAHQGTGGDGGGTGGSGGEEPKPSTSLDLRGDPTFQIDDLDDSAPDQFGVTHRAWYQRLRNSIALGNLSGEFDENNTRPWNRTGASTVAGWMQVFRYTGDMALLDESVRLMELAWNRMVTVDGRRFWSGNDEILDTGLAAGHVALVAWACHNNRDLQSPAGHDYGAIADKYKNWLLTDHIPYWKTNSALPPYDKYQGHTYLYTIRLMHYLGKLGGGGGYTEDQFRAAVTDMVTVLLAGDAYGNIGFQNRPVRLHKHVIADSTSPTGNVLQYTTYVRYEITAVIDLALEGADARLDKSFLTSWANAYADFVLDGDPENTGDPGARTIGGDVDGSSLLGIDYNGTYRSRITANRLVTSAYNYLGGWDARNHAEPYVFAFYPGRGSSTTPTASDFASSRVFNLFHHGK